jgi:hypothetical protein
MTRPPLSIALSSVLAAQVDGAGRPALLATLHPQLGRAPARPTPAEQPSPRHRPGWQDQAPSGLAPVIPLPRRHLESTAEQPDPDPTPAA